MRLAGLLGLGLVGVLGAEPVRSVEATWAVRQEWATTSAGTGVEASASVSGFGLPGLWLGASVGADTLAWWSTTLRAGVQMPWGRSGLVVPWLGASGPSWRALAGVDAEVRLWDRLHGVVGLAVTSGPSLVVSLGFRDRTSWRQPLPEGPAARVVVGADGLSLRFEASGGAPAALWSWSIVAPGGQVFFQASGEGSVPSAASWTGVSLWGETMASATRYEVVLKVTDGLGRVTESRASFATDLFVLFEGRRALVRLPRPRDEDPAVLGRLVQLLSAHKGTVTVTGHTDLVQWLNPARAQDENTRQAVPQTLAWAQALKAQLTTRGIDPGRLVVQGEGGRHPLVPFGDETNAWKNRRLEVSWEPAPAPR